MKKVSILFAMVAFVFAGCATIVSKSSYPVNITSTPAGAEIEIKTSDGKVVFTGKTPTQVVLEAGKGYFSGEDYTVTFNGKQTAQIERGLDGWYLVGNLFFGAVIGWLIIDPATGAMWTLSDLHVNLDSTASTQQNGLTVTTLDQVPDHLLPHLIKVN